MRRVGGGGKWHSLLARLPPSVRGVTDGAARCHTMRLVGCRACLRRGDVQVARWVVDVSAL